MRQLTMAATATLLIAAAAVLALFLWLRAYTPLDASGTFRPGAGLGADIEPTFGSGGKTVYIPAYKPGRPFETTFTLHNTGRFAVTVDGLAGNLAAGLAPEALLDPGHTRPIHGLRIDPHETAIVVVRWLLDCSKATGGEMSADNVRLRYSYLSLFTRTDRVVLPFAVTLRCHGGPPPSP